MASPPGLEPGAAAWGLMLLLSGWALGFTCSAGVNGVPTRTRTWSSGLGADVIVIRLDFGFLLVVQA